MKALIGRTVLIVDDEEDFRYVLAEKFRSANAHVLEASSGQEALGIAANKVIDVIVTDIRMSHGDGIELLDKIKTKGSEFPLVIIVSGFHDLPPDVANQKGAVAIFSKPCDLDEIVRAANRHLLPVKERLSIMRPGPHEALYLNLSTDSLADCIQMPSPLISIGRGGMFVAIEKRPAIGATIDFQINFASKPNLPKVPFKGIGICRWHRETETFGLPAGVGIEYEYLTDESFKSLADAFENYNPRAYIPRGHQEF